MLLSTRTVKSGLAKWIQGFLTAWNIVSDDSHQITVDYPRVDLWVRNWCQAHPADSMGWAVTAFVQAMRPR
jgi:hypothetical protein